MCEIGGAHRLKIPSHKVGIIKTQIISISNVKKLNTMRRTSEGVKDKSPRHAEGTAHTHKMSGRTPERALSWQHTGKNPRSSCAWKPAQGSLYVLSIVVSLETGILILSTILTSIGCLYLTRKSQHLLILDNAPSPLLLCLVFPAGASVSWVWKFTCNWSCYRCTRTELWSQLLGFVLAVDPRASYTLGQVLYHWAPCPARQVKTHLKTVLMGRKNKNTKHFSV